MEQPATLNTSVNPFHGLASFSEGEQLFERDADVELILGRFWASRVTVLFAGSGVGKSSFLNAKLVPFLKQMCGAHAVVISDSWARENPEQALQKLRLSLVSQAGEKREATVMVLDQFEEIFQYFPNQHLLASVGSELAHLVNESSAPLKDAPSEPNESATSWNEESLLDDSPPEPDIRLMISLREEFLADLSAFDSYLPGIFANYYRLDRFSASQAKVIIEETALTRGVRTHENVAVLLEDLLGGGGNSPKTEQATNMDGFIHAPFLQIACRGVWQQEQPSDKQDFLKTYRRGQAKEELNAYCRRILNEFGWRERKALSKALAQLTGPREAKRSVHLSELAVVLGMSNTRRLRAVLGRLSEPNVRILRQWTETATVDGATKEDEVYQLYHDMYAPLLWKWKTEQETSSQRWLFCGTITALLAVIFVLVMPIISWIGIHNLLARPHGGADEIMEVLDARNTFSRTVILRGLGDHVWREYNDQLAAVSALKGDMDGALLHKFASRGIDQSVPVKDVRQLFPGPARYLYGSFKSSTSSDFSDLVLVGNETDSSILGATTGGDLIHWKLGQTAPLSLLLSPDSIKLNNLLPVASVPGGEENEVSEKIVCFSPKGNEALIAWISNPAPRRGQPPGAIVGTSTRGMIRFAIVAIPLKGEQHASVTAPLSDTFTESRRSPSNLTFLPSGSGHIAPTAPVDNGSNLGPISPLEGVQGVFSDDGNRVAIVYQGRHIVVWDRKTRRKLVCDNGGYTTQILFSKADHNELAFSYTQGVSDNSGLQQVARLRVTMTGIAVEHPSRTMILPTGSRLIFRRSDDALLARGDIGGSDLSSVWLWYIPAGEIIDRIVLPKVALPQAYSDDDGVLLSQDAFGRLILSRQKRDDTEFVVLAISNPRAAETTPNPKKLTAASLANFGGRHDFVSFDPSDATIRYWSIPAEAVWANATSLQQASRSSDLPRALGLNAQNTATSIDGRWKASLNNNRLTVHETDIVTSATPALSATLTPHPGPPIRLLLGMYGRRVIMWYGDEIEYVTWDQSGGAKIVHVRDAKGVREVAFGPGNDQVTVLSANELQVYRPLSGDTPLWQTSQLGLQLLHDSDESGVVLLAQSVIHRLTESTVDKSAWRRTVDFLHRLLDNNGRSIRVTSVLIDAPLSPAMLVDDQALGSRKLWVRGSTSISPRIVDFDHDDNLWTELDRRHHKLFGASTDECEVIPVDSLNGISPLCAWELSSGRMLKSETVE